MIDLRPYCKSRYRMNDDAADTTVVDWQGFSDGTAQQNTEDLATTGKINGALTFNGSTDYIDANNTFNPILGSNFSVCVWAKTGSNSQQSVFGFRKGGGIPDFFLDYQNNKVPFITYNTGAGDLVLGGSYASFPRLSAEWHWFYAEFYQDGSNVQGYFCVDNDSDISESDFHEGDMSNFATSSQNFNIGYDLLYRLNGSVDDLMFFNRPLIIAERDFLWNDGAGTEELTDIVEKLFTGDIVVSTGGNYSIDCPLIISSSSPLPLTVRALIPRIVKTGR